MPHFEEERTYCFANVCLSVCNLFVSDQELKNTLTYLLHTLSILGSLGQRSPLSNMPKLFPINYSRTPWPTFLKLAPHIRPGQQKNPIDLGSKFKVTGSNVSKLFECLKQHCAHPHEVNHQLGSAPHRVFRSFKPRPLREADQDSSNHMITTPHWIASSSPGLFNHSQPDSLSAACPSAFTAALRCLPTMPRELNVVNTDCAG